MRTYILLYIYTLCFVYYHTFIYFALYILFFMYFHIFFIKIRSVVSFYKYVINNCRFQKILFVLNLFGKCDKTVSYLIIKSQ